MTTTFNTKMFTTTLAFNLQNQN